VRKQYHFWPGASRLDAWDVDRLVALTCEFPVKQVPVAEIWELDTVYWSETMTPREIATHVRLTNEVDLQYPIILGSDGRVMDGMHRVLRAVLEGREVVDAVQFEVDPDPDYTDVTPDELPYPDASPS
jgi:hypothetical protein